MNTYTARPGDFTRSWYVVDAQDQVLGRMATRITQVLRGKHKVLYTSHVDTGDFVIVINAGKVRLTGRKLDQKLYYNYSGYPGGLRSRPARELLQKDPERVIRQAIRGMLPKNRLSRQIIKKLKVYAGPEHPHVAQQPLPLPEHV